MTTGTSGTAAESLYLYLLERDRERDTGNGMSVLKPQSLHPMIYSLNKVIHTSFSNSSTNWNQVFKLYEPVGGSLSFKPPEHLRGIPILIECSN